MSRYLTIRADARCSAFAATSPLVAFLATLPELRKTGPVAFEAAEGQPWVAVIVTVCSPEGNYASGGHRQIRAPRRASQVSPLWWLRSATVLPLAGYRSNELPATSS